MSKNNVINAAFGVPRDFICEHTTSKSRVLALVQSDGPASLSAVLTCTDPLITQRAASVLAAATSGSAGDEVAAEAERVAAELPDAPAASFRQALQYAYDGAWPLPVELRTPTWSQIHDSYAYDITDDQPVTPLLRDSVKRTPSDAHLADLKGHVFRVVNMVELHVHDPQRLLAAARTTRWEPPEDDLDPVHVENLLDASMTLVGISAGIPGADIVTETAQGEHLDPSRGDEVADWSEDPIEADFGRGWRLRREAADSND